MSEFWGGWSTESPVWDDTEESDRSRSCNDQIIQEIQELDQDDELKKLGIQSAKSRLLDNLHK